MRRALRPGFFKKVSRTSVVEHYGVKTLMYGVLLPGPDIGAKTAAEMRATRDADRRMRDVGINSVPSLVVAEKYKINMNVGRRASLDVADQLIAMELAGAESPDADGAGAPR